jgi:hypothetical protein
MLAAEAADALLDCTGHTPLDFSRLNHSAHRELAQGLSGAAMEALREYSVAHALREWSR